MAKKFWQFTVPDVEHWSGYVELRITVPLPPKPLAELRSTEINATEPLFPYLLV
jgi:hypothetical protein